MIEGIFLGIAGIVAMVFLLCACKVASDADEDEKKK